MERFLDNYISSVSSEQSIRVAELLNEIKVSKEELPKIIKGIEDYGQDAPVALTYTVPGSTVKIDPVDQSIRDVRQALENLYDMSNFVSLILENSALLLQSEVAALEDDLVAMEKSVENYGFLMGGSNAFNFSYLETFADNTGRDPMPECSDRASQTFGPAEKAVVNPKEGTLTLPKNQVVSYGFKYSVANTNVSSSDFSKGKNLTTAWRLNVDTESPITSSLPEAQGHKGAQAVLDYVLSAAAPSSEISIAPYSDTPVELIQVTTFLSKNDAKGQDLLAAPLLVDQTKTFHFPVRSVYKVRIVVNQPAYTRVARSVTAEDEYRAAYAALQQRLKDLKDKLSYDRAGDFNHLLFTVLCYFNTANNRPMPRYLPFQYQGPAGIPALIEAIKRASRPAASHQLGLGRPITRVPMRNVQNDPVFDLDQFIQTMFKKKDELYDMLAQREVSLFENSLKRKGIYDPTGVLSPLQMIYSEGWTYRYSLGLQNVGIGVSTTRLKGFHVTKPLDAPGDIGEVSIKTKETHFREPSGLLDNSLFTSVEYSVSNRTTPKAESDWIPILPVGTTIVESERLFPDETGRCQFRFRADPGASITTYKNGKTLVLPTNSYEYDPLQQTVVAVRIPVTDYSTDDILTVTYSVGTDVSNISFANYGFELPPLSNAYDETGAGEGYSATSGNNEVKLSFDPYIDQVKADASPYSLTYGMVTYQPISVRVSGGQIATNYTNYSGEQAPMPESGYYFIQSGRSLIFNKPVTEPFRVYYQYLQNSVRVRTVLRCNSKQFVTPKVDSLQIKGKTRRANRRGLL